MLSHLRSRHYFTSGFPLYIAEISQGAITEHSHEFYEMVYVRRGRGEHFIGDAAYPIQTGDLYVISPGEKHRYAPAAGDALRIVNVLWMPSLVEKILKEEAPRADKSTFGGALLYIEPLLRRKMRFAHRLHLSGRTAYRVESLLDEMRREQTVAAPGCELLLRHLFCALLVLLSRAYDEQHRPRADKSTFKAVSAGQEIVARAIEYIEAHCAEAVRVEDVAAHAALSPSRLAHLFKEHTGRGVIEYLHELRLSRVCAQLIESTLPVQEIAADAGYSDLRFFHRVFRRHAGCNPTQYRRHFGQRETAA